MDDKGSNGIEARLRGLILTNAEAEGVAAAPQQENTLPTFQPLEVRDLGGLLGQAPSSMSGNNPASKPPRKRPNQAQRRQMSTQLSIPVDPRPQPPQFARPHASPGYPHQQHAVASQHGIPRLSPGHYRSPSQGNALPAALLPDMSSAAQARHHPSQSHHRQLHPGDRREWRQPSQQGGEPRGAYQAPTMALDANAPRNMRHNNNASLYNPGRQYQVRPEDLTAQSDLLEGLCNTIIADAEIEPADIMEKETFRARIERVARSVITRYETEQNGLQGFPPESVQLRCFGSLSSGFATKAADMDLGLLSPCSRVQPDAPGSPIPRLVEKAFLEIGVGARLLTRTRVPIIKICERPPAQLRADLLEERAKWEKGVTEELEEDAIHEEHDTIPMDEVQPHDYREHESRGPLPEPRQIDLNSEKKFRALKQGENKTLASYYSAAKTLLRKLGGRDLTSSNLSTFNKDDFRFLNEFCLAFVDGLADHMLRDRLFRYQSLSKYDLTENQNYRSLLGVYMQAEGEQMVMMWESRQLPERAKQQEQQAQSTINFWKDLQNKSGYGSDPLGYNKELGVAWEQLRRIPSLQVTLLSQKEYESAAVYHSRAIKAMLDLGGHDTPQENPVLPIVVQHYIQGIMGEDIRRQVQEFSRTHQPLTLRAVARRHKSLQLAHDFERCLRKGLYPESSVPCIKTYVDLLRGPMAETMSPNPHFDYVVPLTPDFDPVLSQIRLLGDPSKMAPNQPRDPYRDRLEFPKSGVGVQCDINFSAHLALQNTLLLRCYAYSDPRVRPLVLFVKHWAKVRQINTPYRGTLSSYGYVLMMLHYLVNVAQPFVCPNLQQLAPTPDPNLTPEQIEETVSCKGRNIQFWRDEAAIQRLARENALNQNRDSIGHLLRGFFEYYAQNYQMSTVQSRGFDWGRDVLSLRTYGGLLSKQEKGWTGAKTTIEQVSPDLEPSVSSPAGPQNIAREVKEVRHRYLFAIEDPFELDHNVARTVTHNGIVAIRDEFRRAWRIIRNAGKGQPQEDLLEDVAEAELRQEREQFSQLLDELHGPRFLERRGADEPKVGL
ncbi:hypothetical protein B0T22DRAFT_527699 [Podospora appendiculata]|uniref:polynucleotide adenylyltransferase n=1 Tax=Podospora appendiculata TaxID=314037 RepID=A0AAE0X987_9PEZI|nr:hypothetical protein B0T22DRAFT_527699 [Podospora appendiculata]